MDVCNVSMGTTKKNFFGTLHNLADRAYFQNTVLVTAANNMPVPSFPSLYASEISVASHEGHDPHAFYYNPEPPVEFAAPHITGVVAKILGKHPYLTLFQMKTVLRALSANMARGAANRQVASPDG